jgi:uncharacterized DUF497 family protein
VNINEILSTCSGFDWDEGNILKNWIKHRVIPIEVEQVFFNTPLLLLPDKKHSAEEERFIAMGKTDSGRLLFISWTVRNGLLRPISARTMHVKERTLYEQEA